MNDNSFSITCGIDKNWDIVKKAREKVEALVSKISKDLAYASKMVTSELIENALKYGSHEPNKTTMSYHLDIKNHEIKIIVSNSLHSLADLKTVTAHIDKIKNTRNPQKLYKNRLLELMESTKNGNTQLGLYRIAYEGKFDIDYTYEDNTLTITATRQY